MQTHCKYHHSNATLGPLHQGRKMQTLCKCMRFTCQTGMCASKDSFAFAQRGHLAAHLRAYGLATCAVIRHFRSLLAIPHMVVKDDVQAMRLCLRHSPVQTAEIREAAAGLQAALSLLA
jgi:hypothetical protein